MRFNLSEIAKIVGGTLHGDDIDIVAISTDSRKITQDSLFVALTGEKFDGHDFIQEALRQGAKASLSSRPTSEPYILVNDTQKALGELAQAYRKKLRAIVIAITGSSGKTSTKDFMKCALEPFGNVVSSKKSLNNEIGVPLTIFQADDTTDFLILEMGMRGLGQIDYLTSIAQPNVSILLNAGSAHLSELGSRENILLAKSEIFNHMSEPKLGITSADDERLVAVSRTLGHSVILFGQSSNAELQIQNLQITPQGFPQARITFGNKKLDLTLPRLGEHQMINAAAVLAAINGLELSFEIAVAALAQCEEVSPWRMEVVALEQGITLINDAYNANPESVRAGLKALKDFAQQRRTWAVLGEMRELGDSALEEHDAIGRLCVRLDISKTLAVGESARSIQLGASHEGSWNQEALFAATIDDAITLLIEQIEPEDVIFIKASRAVGLERVAKALEEHFGGKNRLS